MPTVTNPEGNWEISMSDIMSLETERELYARMKDGDDYARDDLIMGHEWLIDLMVRKYSRNADPEDVRQEAWLSLIKVVDRYDINKGRLGSYAPYFLKKDVVRYLDKQRHFIRLPAGTDGSYDPSPMDSR